MSKILTLLKKQLSACCMIYLLLVSLNASAGAGRIPDRPDHPEKDKLFAQITGTVKDRLGKPIPGVTVTVVGTTGTVTITDENGRFTIDVDPKGSLQFTHVNYKTSVMAVNNTIDLEIMLDAAEGSMDEVVITSFGQTQKRISQVGAQSSVRVSDLKQPTSNISASLAGRIAGVIGVQRTGEPGRDAADIFIRGIQTFSGQGNNDRPLVLIDGVERDLNSIDPEDIQEFSVLKDASATAVYGVRGANGVVLIKTKTGRAGKTVINANYTQGVSTFTKIPNLADGVTYMHLTNEALAASGQPAKYSQAYINNTASGNDPYVYPNVDWMKAVFNNWGQNRRANFNATGGATNANYYVALSYYDETGFLKNDALSDYNADTRFKRYNFTSNLNLTLTPSTKLDLGVQGNISNLNSPGVYDANNSPSQLAFAQAMQITPVLFPVMYPNNIVPGQSSNGDQRNPYADIIQRGYQNFLNNQLYSNLRLSQNLDFWLKGLSFTTMFAFDARNNHIIIRNKRPDTYYINSTDPRKPDGTLNLFRSFTSNQPNLNYQRVNGGNRKFYTESALNYHGEFGNDHAISAMLLYNQEDYTDAFAGDLTASIPFRYRGVAGRTTYSFADRYFGEFNFGYNGSENFAPEKRYGFFPSMGLGWVVSNEKFFEPVKKAVQLLKFRYSDGLVGSGSGGRRFGFLTIVNELGGVYAFGMGRSSVNGVQVQDYGVDITWSTSRKQDLGIEIQTLNNGLKLTVDLFKEHRKDVFLQRGTTPATMGLTNRPWGNLGVIDNKGLDATLETLKALRIGNVGIDARGTFTYAKNKVIEDDSPSNAALPWQDTRGKQYLSPLLYIAEGLFQTQDEISKSPTQTELFAGGPRPGDIRYKDVSGDGKINANDRVRVENIDIPAVVYGFGLNVSYKNFYIAAFAQGTGKAYRYINGDGVIPFNNSTGADRSNLFAMASDRWTVANPNPDAFYPRLGWGTANTNNTVPSTFWMKDVAFVRLKNAEIGYNLPRTSFTRLGVKSSRIYLEGTNLFTRSKFDLWDPELNTSNGTRYPLVTAISLGVQATF